MKVSSSEFKMGRQSFLKFSNDVVGYVSKQHFVIRKIKINEVSKQTKEKVEDADNFGTCIADTLNIAQASTIPLSNLTSVD